MRYSDLTPFGRMVVTTLAILALLLLMGVAGAIETSAAPMPKKLDCTAIYERMMHTTNKHTQMHYWVIGWQSGCFHND